MRLSDKDLEVFTKHIGKVPFINMTKENVEILKSIVDELIKLRRNNELIVLKLEEIKGGTTDEFTYNDLKEFIEKISR